MLKTKTFDLSNLSNLVILVRFNWFIDIKLSIYIIVLTIEEIQIDTLKLILLAYCDVLNKIVNTLVFNKRYLDKCCDK